SSCAHAPAKRMGTDAQAAGTPVGPVPPPLPVPVGLSIASAIRSRVVWFMAAAQPLGKARVAAPRTGEVPPTAQARGRRQPREDWGGTVFASKAFVNTLRNRAWPERQLTGRRVLERQRANDGSIREMDWRHFTGRPNQRGRRA